MTGLPFAADIPDYLLVPIKVLALIGAAAAGGFGASWTTKAIVKLSFGQNVPDKMAWFVRLLGFVASGLLAYFWLFGAGGGGVGGGGGGLFGVGSKDGGPKDGTVTKKDDSSRKEQKKDKEKEDPPVPTAETIRVEVLGDDALKRIVGPSFQAERRYRIVGKPDLLTLKEAQDAVSKRRSGKPGLRKVEIILYADSPDRKRPQVAMLEAWVKDVSEPDYPLSIRVSDEEGNAP